MKLQTQLTDEQKRAKAAYIRDKIATLASKWERLDASGPLLRSGK